METHTPSRTTTSRHHHHVRLQRRVHRARRLLLEAADQLHDVDLSIRADDADLAEDALRRAAEVAAAAQHEMRALHRDPEGTITLP